MTDVASEQQARGRRRLSDEFETVGVAAIPERQRRYTPFRLFVIWTMASASALTPIIGQILFNFGLGWMVAVIVLAWMLAFVPAGLFTEMGREMPLTALIVARRTFGHAGALVFSLLFTVVNAAFFGLNTAVAGQLLGALAHSSATPWTWLIGIVQTVLVLIGMRLLEPFYRYTALLFVVCYGVLTYYLFANHSLHLVHSHGSLAWGPALTTVLSISILAWTYKLSTVSRFAVPTGQERHGRAGYFLMPSVGIMLAVLVLAVIGMLSQEGTGNWNVALLGANLSGLGTVAALGVVVAVVHTNAMNLYPSTVDMLVAMNTVLRPFRLEQPVGTLLLGIASTLLAVVGILNHIQGFLNDIGDVIFPFTFIMIIDWILVQRRATPAEAFFDKPRRWTDWLDPVATVAFLVGLAFNLGAVHVLPHGFTNQVPLPFVGALLSAVVFVALARFSPHRSADQRAGGTVTAPTAPR